MGNFKVGDKVVSTDDVSAVTTRITGIKPGGVYTVEEACGAIVALVESFKPGFTFSAECFKLLEEQDDPLPPAPESVVYFNSIRDKGNDQCITVRPDDDPRYEGTLCISIHPRGDYNEYKSVVLDPDAALQLAHDLNRMANEIKRKERNNT